MLKIKDVSGMKPKIEKLMPKEVNLQGTNVNKHPQKATCKIVRYNQMIKIKRQSLWCIYLYIWMYTYTTGWGTERGEEITWAWIYMAWE